MRVQCEQCSAEYNIDEARVPPEGLQIKCPRCMATFIVSKAGPSGGVAGDLFELDDEPNLPPPPGGGGGGIDLGGDDGESLELDLPEEPDAPNLPPDQSGDQIPDLGDGPGLPPVPGGASLPPIGGGSSLPPVGGAPEPSPFSSPPGESGLPSVPPPAAAPGPAPQPGSEGQIFDFIDKEIGTEEQAAPSEGQAANYRIRRKSGKVFGPFDEVTVKKMLAEHQLMGNEEASTDGRTFKPLGAFDEFAQVIRELMEEPVVGSVGGSGSSVEAVDDDIPVDVDMAPRGIDFAEPPAEGKARSGPGALTFLALALVLLVVVAGVGLGFTRYGWFGYKMFTGSAGGGGGGGGAGGGGGGGPVVDQSRMQYFEDTHAGYKAVADVLEKKVRAGDAELEDLYLLGLAYAALLRNYGANPMYVQRAREILEMLKDEEPDSPERKKVEAALLILTSPDRALTVLGPAVGPKSRDKEALYLAGWAAAYQKKWKEAAAFFDRATVLDPDYAKAYHALGDIQALQGDFGNALLFYEKAHKKNPRHINSVVEMARIEVEVKRDLKRGEELLKIAFGKHNANLAPSERAKAHHLRAQIHMKSHEADKVVQDLKAAIQLVPGKVEFMAALGSYYLELGEFGKAREVFEQALQKDAADVDAQLGKGRAMWKSGDIVKAKMHIESIAKKHPKDPRPLYYLGRIAEDLEQVDDAVKRYKTASKLAKNYLLPRVALARLRLKQNNLKAALEQLTRANKIDPKSAVVRTGLGEVYFKQKNWRLAEVEFREAIKLDPDLASAHFNLANTFREQGEFAEAETEYQRAREISPRFPDLSLERGYNLYLQDKAGEALKVFEEAIRENPKDDRLYVRAGLAAKASEQPDAAIKYFQSAAGLNNTNAEAYFQLGLMFQDKGEHDQALELLKEAAGLDRERAEIRYHIGLSYLATDMPRDAVDEFRAAIKLKSNYVEALVQLGNALAERLQYAEAIRYYKRVVREKPDRVDVMLSLGDAYSQQSQFSKALKLFQKAYKKKPKAEGAAYRLARTLDELNRKNKAIKYYLAAAKVDPRDPMPHFYLGYAYKAIRLNAKALGAFKRYLQLKPDAPDADEIQDEIYYLEQD